jgi:hypothetical protein
MMDDLLVDWSPQYDSEGNIDPNLPNIKDVKVFPIHPDDEIILFQRPGTSGVFSHVNKIEQITQNGCVCCYGSEKYQPQRTQTIRQKYKYTGCSWTWWPPKFAINGDPSIPQCGTSSYFNSIGEKILSSDCFYII